MAFRVNEFIAQLQNKGVSHKADFEVIITPPAKLRSLISSRELALRANRADLPGRSIQSVPIRHTIGPERQLAYNVSHVPITMSFIADAGMNVKKLFEAWQDLAIGTFRNPSTLRNTNVFNVGYYTDYIGTIEITQFERPMRKVYRCKLLEVYPVTLNPLDSDWSSEAIHELNVTWNYRYFEVLDLQNSSVSGPGGSPNFNFVQSTAATISGSLGKIPTIF
jgi:hypothetical protein